MLITKKQSEEMLEAAKPLLEWLNNNTHPMCSITITGDAVELKEGIATQRTDEFVID